MVNRTRVEGGGYSKHDIIARYYKYQQAGCSNIVLLDVLRTILSFYIVPGSNQINWVDYTGPIICGHKL